MTWKLVREVGIDVDSSRVDISQQRLCYPTYAAFASDGTYVIAEELGIDKLVPFRFECRTLRVDQYDRVFFDSRSIGIDDGYGCLMGDDGLAIVRRTHWELVIVSRSGDEVHRFGLERCSKRLPRYARWTRHGTFLVVFFNRSFDIDIVELDPQGELLWYLPQAAASRTGIPSSVELLADGNLLIADAFRHCVQKVSRGGEVLWQFGEIDAPACDVSHVASPASAACRGDGQIVIADTRNHRVIAVASDGQARPIPMPQVGVCDPSYAMSLPQGDHLICDTGNGRVMHLDARGNIAWEFGSPRVTRRQLSYPRSAALVGPGRNLVADTGNNRIVEFRDGSVETKCSENDHSLFWPRCVRYTPTGTMLIADARNGRIVEVSAEGRVLNELREFQIDGRRPFKDPHDVHLMANGHLLVCDSSRDCVLEVDWSGCVCRIIGTKDGVKLDDPHSAQPLRDGSVLITDTGHHRLLIVGLDGNVTRIIQSVEDGARLFRLHSPRYAEAATDDSIIIADTGQNRILACTYDGQFLWEFSRVPTSEQEFLDQPRWATLVKPNELLVCDHFHHRILHVERMPAPEATGR